MFLELINLREASPCCIQVPLFPFQRTKSLHLPTEYILTSALYYEDGLEILLWTQILVLLCWLRLGDLQYWAVCTKCIWPQSTFGFKKYKDGTQEGSGKEY